MAQRGGAVASGKAKAAHSKPAVPGKSAATLADDQCKLLSEILDGLDSDEEEAPGARSTPPNDSGGVELTEAAVLEASGEDKIDDVTQLIFRDKMLASLETPRSLDLDRLVNLEVLSLSHNLLEDIEPLSMLVALVEVNLNFNGVVDLSPLYDCEQLEKLFISHNKIKSVDGLEIGCPKLRELSLFANCLEDNAEVMECLCGLPELRELHIGENGCCAAPSQRHGLICKLPSLELLDGQKLTDVDRKFAAAFLRAASKEDGTSKEDDADSADEVITETVVRPVTAPSVCSRPPLPHAMGSVALAPLPGGKLRSSRANRIDDLLTQSREASPEIEDSGVPAFDLKSIDLSNPDRALSQLTVHHSALKQWLDTMQIDRENLRFQVRLLEQDKVAQHMDQLHADIARLEVENRSNEAVQSENKQLQARLDEVTEELNAARQKPVLLPTTAADKKITQEDEDVLDQLRWENKLLEKRLDRMKKLGEQTRYGFLVTQVNSRQQSSPQGRLAAKADEVKVVNEAVDPELSSLLADNEAMLKGLQRDVLQTASGKPHQSSVQAGLKKHVKQSQVDVLTIAGEGSEDAEWHSHA